MIIFLLSTQKYNLYDNHNCELMLAEKLPFYFPLRFWLPVSYLKMQKIYMKLTLPVSTRFFRSNINKTARCSCPQHAVTQWLFKKRSQLGNIKMEWPFSGTVFVPIFIGINVFKIWLHVCIAWQESSTAEVLGVVLIKITFFIAVMPCILVDRYWTKSSHVIRR
jgi:hypothetical protein